MNRKLRIVPDSEAVFLGVCGGIAYWLGVPAWIVRLATVASVFFTSGIVLFAYYLLWAFMPEWEELPEDYEKRAGG